MATLPRDISYEQWLTHVFDHPFDPQSKSWWHLTDDVDWNPTHDPLQSLRYVTAFFKRPGVILNQYSHGQIDQGLAYIVDGSECMHLLRDPKLPLQAREACIHAMEMLYRDLMVPLYGPEEDKFTHDPQQPNYACYMWWDIICIGPGMDMPSAENMEQAVFRVFRSVLTLKAEPCLTSVLHGLGHWQSERPREVESIIRHFLRTRKDISQSIREYAQQAMQGHVM